MKNKPFPYYDVPQFATISELLELTRNKYGEKISFGLIIGLTISIIYACLRINYFPNFFQFEHLLTTVIIITSYFVWVRKKEAS